MNDAAAVASFPGRSAATQRFTLGAPRALRVATDGSRVTFLRAHAGDDPSTGLWVLDIAAGTERLIADGGSPDDSDLPPAERARRERAREGARGVTAYDTDPALRRAVFAVAGTLFVADLQTGALGTLRTDGPAVQPLIDPTGRWVAYAGESGPRLIGADGIGDRALCSAEGPDVTWGLPEFIAAEEMGRHRGLWWAPTGDTVAMTRVDTSGVPVWHVGDPATPGRPPRALRYPRAGAANADVRLFLVQLDDERQPQQPREITWDRHAFCYLADVVWQPDGPLTLVVQSRDQKGLRILGVDGETLATSVMAELHDEHWLELVPGVPRWLPEQRLVHVRDIDGTRRLTLDGDPVTPPGLQVRGVLDIVDAGILVAASDTPTEVGVWTVPTHGGEPRRVSEVGTVASAVGSGAVVAVTERSLDRVGAALTVLAPVGDLQLVNHAEHPPLQARVELLSLGERDLCAALVLPDRWREGDAPLPVLLDPYGGPHAQRVLASHDAYLTSQWFAEAGFAVLVVDGRGTPGRGPAWERAVAGDLAGPVLADQVDALHAAAAQHPALDLDRVAIRGWSFGGYLAALAVLRRPDVFHAGIAGAPVTDWALYDTHYTERYLGLPQRNADAYARSSLLKDAPDLQRPLLLIHGLTDDNVVAAHTLQLSRALFEAGRDHEVLPLSGVTHMTPQAVVAENLLHWQLRFLRRSLGLEAGDAKAD